MARMVSPWPRAELARERTRGTLTAIMLGKMLAVSLLFAGTVVAQEPVHSEPPVYVTAIDLIAEVRDQDGKLSRDLKAEDFTVLEDDVERKVIGLEYLDAPPPDESGMSLPYMGAKPEWQIVVYFDSLFSSTINLRHVSNALAAQAEELAEKGTVEIVVGDMKTELALPATRDVEAIRRGLKDAGLRGAKDFLTVNRRRFAMDLDDKTSTPAKSTSRPNTEAALPPVVQPNFRLDQVRPYVMQEIEMAQRFRRNLLEWMARYPRQRPRLLLLVSGGFEYDPVAYYFGFSQGSKDAQRAREEFSQYNLGAPISAMAKTLAASAWTTISVDSPSGAGEAWIDDGGRSGIGRVRNLTVDHPGQGSAFTSRSSRDPLLALADATGGSVVQRAQLDEMISDLGGRVKITYQVSRPPDGKTHKVAVRANRPGLTVRTMKWSSEATPDDIAAVRAAQILRDGNTLGELPTTLKVEWTPGTTGVRSGNIVVDSSLAPIASVLASRRSSYRVTILARQAGQQPMLLHRIVNDYDPSKGKFRYTAPITAPASKLELAIVVEELTTGVWGGARTQVQ